MNNLATLDALTGDTAGARSLLSQAAERGSSAASDYAATLDPNPQIQQDASHRLQARADEDDTDALNFLGLAAYAAGRLNDARQFWTTSTDLGDFVAPLLLHLTGDTASG